MSGHPPAHAPLRPGSEDILPQRNSLNGSEVLRLGLVQMRSFPSREKNLDVVRRLLARTENCDLLLFPEYVFCMGNPQDVADAALDAEEWHALLGGLAAAARIRLAFGGVPVRHEQKIRNAFLIYEPDGTLLARYDKIHLFQLHEQGRTVVNETQMFEHGEKAVCVEICGWKIALSICYDLRFPELYRMLAPFDLLLAPAAFMQSTGRAHWDILLRAAAVHNQCFSAAAAQCGTNAATGTACYGHSLLADPWGEVLFDAGSAEQGVFLLLLERRKIEEARNRLPALENRRILMRDERSGMLGDRHLPNGIIFEDFLPYSDAE